MILNMYKIVGELLLSVFYVVSWVVMMNVLNIFGDYGDVMVVR